MHGIIQAVHANANQITVLNLIFSADFDLCCMELDGQQFAITANRQEPLAANGIMDVSHVGVLRRRLNASEWLCLTCDRNKQNCDHVRAAGPQLSVSDQSAFQHEQRWKRWFNVESGNRRLTCLSRMRIPMDLMESVAYRGGYPLRRRTLCFEACLHMCVITAKSTRTEKAHE
jgi:hypothetical protein